MSVTSRARAAAREKEQFEARSAYWRAKQESNARELTLWYARQGINEAQREALHEAAVVKWEESKAANGYEPVPHWVIPIGDALVNPEYFHPPTAEINGKPSPVLSVQAFHHTLPIEGVTFQRVALGEPWVRAA